MKLKELCRGAGLICPEAAEECEITGISTSSERVRAGEMFVCIRGLRYDGHDYIDQAIKHGAACILTDRYANVSAQGSTVFLQCSDSREAVARLYHAWYGSPGEHIKLIGVTGTNGKTSVTHMIRAILEASMYRTGLIGTVGCFSAGGVRMQTAAADALANMTTPDPEILYRVLAEMRADGVEYVVMEVSSHALELKKLAPLRFEAAVFTNLTPEHLDFHKTMDAYAAAKAKLMSCSKLAVCNADSPYAPFMERHATGRVMTCTAGENEADFCAEEIAVGESGVSYRLRSLRTRLQLSCPVAGSFTVMNSMQAAICALELGCSPAVIKTALAALPPITGRMERVRLGFGADFTVLIDYAHTPDALEKLLRTARGLCRRGGRLTLLFGCGGDRDRAKRPVMGEIASRLADEVIVTSDNSRSEDPMQIIREIVAGMSHKMPACIIPEREKAITYAVHHARAGDILLLAGKGHEEYEITREGKRAFSEKEIVKRAYAARMEHQKPADGWEGRREDL